MDADRLLSKLPPFENKELRIINEQSVNDIINEVLEAHCVFSQDYDLICEEFGKGSIDRICRELFIACKQNVKYVIEDDFSQTTRSPAAILALGKLIGGDCKHYSQFIAGILSALNRKGYDIDWTYRFASYDAFDPTKQHVFVVVFKDDGKEIWIDPVLETYDSRSRIPFYVEDHTIDDMALSRIYGLPKAKEKNNLYAIKGFADTTTAVVQSADACGCNQVGQVNFSDVASDIDQGNYVSAAIQLIPAIVNTIKGREYTIGRYKLGEKYIRHVLGQTITSNTQVPDEIVLQAMDFFSKAFGVPITTVEDLDNLDPNYNTSGNNVQDYMNRDPLYKDLPISAVQAAVEIKRLLPYSNLHWDFKSVYQQLGLTGTQSNTTTNSTNTTNNVPLPNNSNMVEFNLWDFIKKNPVESLLVGTAVTVGIIYLTRKKKKRKR